MKQKYATARVYCYFIKKYSGKKLRVRKIYKEHCKESGPVIKVEPFSTPYGYTSYFMVENLQDAQEKYK